MLLRDDGSVEIAGDAHPPGKPFRRHIGEWTYYASGLDRLLVHAARDWTDRQYVFEFVASGWQQHGEFAPWNSVNDDREDLPHLRELTLKANGAWRIGTRNYRPDESVSTDHGGGRRVRKRRGLGEPLVLLATDDEYLAFVYTDDEWFVFSPQLPRLLPSPWHRVPNQSLEANFPLTIPLLELKSGGYYVIDDRPYDIHDAAHVLDRVGPYVFGKAAGSDQPLGVKRLDSAQEWTLFFRDDRWCFEVMWAPLSIDAVLWDFFRFGPDAVQVVKLFTTYSAVEAIGIEFTQNDRTYKLRKAAGEREILWLETPEEAFAFVCYEHEWFLLMPSGGSVNVVAQIVEGLPASPPLPEGFNAPLRLNRRLGNSLRPLALLLRPIAHTLRRLVRICPEQVVWVPATDSRFNITRRSPVSACEVADLPGLGLYHGGSVLLGRTIYGRDRSIDVFFGTRRVRREPFAADVLQIDFYEPALNEWLSHLFRYREGRWERQVARDRRDGVFHFMYEIPRAVVLTLRALTCLWAPLALTTGRRWWRSFVARFG